MADIAYQPPPYGASAPGRDATAVMGRRILAWVLDVVLYSAFAIAIFAMLAEYVDVSTISGNVDRCDVVRSLDEAGGEVGSCVDVSEIAIEGLEGRAWITSDSENGVQTLASIGYFVFFVLLQGLTGASPGKLLTGLRVVDEQGQTAGIGKSLVRTLLWVVDAAPWFVPLVGFIVGLTSTGHRRVGDMAAKTYVVSTKDVGTPVLTAQSAVPPGASAWGAVPPSAPPPPQPGWTPGPQPPPAGAAPPPPGGRVDPSVPESVVPDISGVPGDTPAPPSTAGISSPPQWDDPIIGQEPPAPDRGPTGDVGATEESQQPADESPPDVGVDPQWWSGPEATPEPEQPAADADASATATGPQPDAWEDPSPEPTQQQEWTPPTTPNADFGTTDDPSPTAGPTPFVAPGTDPRQETPSSPQANPAPPPQWDPARNTYIQWDPNQQMWLQWDTVANRWKLIDS